MGNSSDRRILGRLVVSSSGESSGAQIERWRRENLGQYSIQHQRQNSWARGGSYRLEHDGGDDYSVVWYPPGYMTQYQMNLQQKQAEAERQKLQLQMQQSQYEYERMQMALSIPQPSIYAREALNSLRLDPGAESEMAASITSPMAQAQEQNRKKAVKSPLLKIKVWAYSKLSGASPFIVYRQLKREESKE